MLQYNSKKSWKFVNLITLSTLNSVGKLHHFDPAPAPATQDISYGSGSSSSSLANHLLKMFIHLIQMFLLIMPFFISSNFTFTGK